MDNIYWDSDCFLRLLQEEAGAEQCEQVLQDAQDGKIQIITSALTLAEVLAMKKRNPIPKEKQESVSKFFMNEYILVRNVTRKAAERARELVWNHDIDPKDAIHVATALEEKLSMMHTFDKNLIAKSNTVGSPRLIISEPFVQQPRLFALVTGGKKS
jgi:predicted nucleic acid-binding protein